jgi:protein-disulfide isomerase
MVLALRGRKARIAFALLIIGSVIASAAPFLQMFIGRTQPASSIEPLSAPASGVQASSLGSCEGDGPILAIVYAEGQEALADYLAESFLQNLAPYIPNLTICKVPDKGMSMGLRVYPSIFVKGGALPPDLMSFVLDDREVNGFKLLSYEVGSFIIMRIASGKPDLPKPIYTVSGTAVVVQGKLPPARVDPEILRSDMIRSFISAVFAANISEVKVVDEPPEGIHVVGYPFLYVESSYNLNDGAVTIDRIGDNKYIAGPLNFADYLTMMGFIDAYEIDANQSLIPDKHPALGSGSIHVIVYEDYACPYCAMLYRDTMPMLVELASQGRITLHLADFIVHDDPSVWEAHTMALCKYLSTGDPREYYDLTSEIYRKVDEIYSKAGDPVQVFNELEKVASSLREELGSSDCTEAEELVHRSHEIGVRNAFPGTPTIVIWSEGYDRALVIVGYVDPDKLSGILNAVSLQ